MKNLSLGEKDKLNSTIKNNKRISAINANTSALSSKSKSMKKIPLGIDKEEIFREFFAYKINSRSTNKLTRATNLDRSLSNTSKGRIPKATNLTSIKTIKVKKDETGKRTMNISQSDHNKSKDKFYKQNDEIYRRSIKEKELKLNSSEISIETGGSKKNQMSPKLNSIRTTVVDDNTKSRMKNNKINVDIYNLYKVCSLPTNKNGNNNNYTKTEAITNTKNTQEEKKLLFNAEIKAQNFKLNEDKYNTTFDKELSLVKSNNKVTDQQKVLNDNYEKYYQHLSDKLSFLNYKVNEYKIERERLVQILDESKTEKNIYAEKLENEIKSYKNMIDSCVKTCSQLTEELMVLRKEIEKYTSHSTMNHSSSLGFNNHSTNKKKDSNGINLNLKL